MQSVVERTDERLAGAGPFSPLRQTLENKRKSRRVIKALTERLLKNATEEATGCCADLPEVSAFGNIVKRKLLIGEVVDD